MGTFVSPQHRLGAAGAASNAPSANVDPGSGRDPVAAGPGNDLVIARGHAADTIDCGHGRDVAIVDKTDRTRRCEQVRRP